MGKNMCIGVHLCILTYSVAMHLYNTFYHNENAPVLLGPIDLQKKSRRCSLFCTYTRTKKSCIFFLWYSATLWYIIFPLHMLLNKMPAGLRNLCDIS